MSADPVATCAAADAFFHLRAYAALGIATDEADGLWWAVTAGSPVFCTGGSTGRHASAGRMLTAFADRTDPIRIRDCWAGLDLAAAGFSAEPEDPWMLRPAGRIAIDAAPGLRIAAVADARDVVTFERTVIAATGKTPPGHVDGAIHPGPATVADPAFALFVGYLDDEPVATSLAAIAPEASSIGAVAVCARARRRGIGAAMTAAAVASAVDRPATLLASDPGFGVYSSLGFRVVGRGVTWRRPARPSVAEW